MEETEQKSSDRMYFWVYFILSSLIATGGIVCVKMKYESGIENDSTDSVLIMAIFFSWLFWVMALHEYITTQEKQKKKAPDANTVSRQRLTMKILYDFVKPIVLEGYETRLKKVDKESTEEKLKVRFDLATSYMQTNRNGPNAITWAKLETLENTWINTFCRIHSTYAWTVFIGCVVTIHCAALILFSEKLREETTPTLIFGMPLHLSTQIVLAEQIVDATCIFFETIDVTFKFITNAKFGKNIFVSSETVTCYYIQAFLVCFIMVDFFINLFLRISLEFIFPARPFMLIFMNPSLRSEVRCCWAALVDIIPIIIAYFTLILTFGIFTFLTYGIDIEEWNGEPMIGNTIQASIQMMVFFSCGENYVSMFYPAAEQGYSGFILFPIAMFLGIFVFMAIITGIFQNIFAVRRDKLLMRERWFKRTGMTAAFVLLDTDQNSYLSKDEFATYLKYRKDVSDSNKEIILARLEYGDEDKKVTLTDLVHSLEKNKLEWVPKDPDQSEIQIRSQEFMESWLYEKFLVYYCVCTFIIFALYSPTLSYTLDKIIILVVAVHVVEVSLRIWAHGSLHRYLFLHEYAYCEQRRIDAGANALDLIFTLISFIGTFVCLKDTFNGTLDKESQLRMFPAFILLRCFCHWTLTKKIGYLLFKASRQIISLFNIMMICFFIWGVWGVTMFKDGLRDVNWDDPENEVPEYGKNMANFDSLGHAFIFLMQIFLGEAFHELLYVTRESWTTNIGIERGTSDLGGTFYVLSFFFIITILFQNIVIGLLLDIFEQFSQMEDLSGRRNSLLFEMVSEPTILEDESKEFYVHDLVDQTDWGRSETITDIPEAPEDILQIAEDL